MAMMISKFHKIIQSKIVWTAFAILISVAFVSVYTGSKSGMGGSSGKRPDEVAGRLFGEKVTRQEFGSAYQQVFILYTLATGRPIPMTEETDRQISKAAWQRLAILKKAEQMGLSATEDQITDAIHRFPFFQNQQNGAFDPEVFNAFINNVLPQLRMTKEGFAKMMKDNVIIEKASALAMQGVLVTEEEISNTYHLFNDKLTVAFATLPRELAVVPELTEEDAKAYFEENANQFIIPEKVMVRYVEYPVANFTNGVTALVTDEMISQVYENNKQLFVEPIAEDAPAGATPEFKPLEEVKGEITAMIAEELARQEAATAADLMVSDLSAEGADFEALAAAAGLEIVNVPKFARTDSVKGVDPTARFVQAAFRLENNETHYYSDPVVGKDSVYVIALIKKFDAYPPTFEQVKEDVMASAKLAAAEKAYLEKADSIHADIETALKAGMSFTDVAAKLNLTVETSGPFSVMEPPEDPLAQQLLRETALYDSGTLVDLVPTDDEFIVAYLAEKTPADDAALAGMRQQLEANIRADKAQRQAAAWQDKVMEEANLEITPARTADTES